MKDLFVYGASGFGTEILAVVESANKGEWNIKGFIDDTKKAGDKPYKNYQIFGDFEYLKKIYSEKDIAIVIAIAEPKSKQNVVKKIKENLKKTFFPIIIHPSAQINETSTLSEGCIVTNNCILTNNIKIEEFVILNLAVTVGHEVLIKKYTSIMPGVNIGGNTIIGENVYIGQNANIIQKIKIGDNVTIGVGTSIIKDVEPSITIAENLSYVKIPKKTVENI